MSKKNDIFDDRARKIKPAEAAEEALEASKQKSLQSGKSIRKSALLAPNKTVDTSGSTAKMVRQCQQCGVLYQSCHLCPK